MNKITFYCLVFSAAPAWANGGPVAWSGGSARGGIRPKVASSIELREERLSLAVKPDGKQFSVKAVYRLFNPKPPEALSYGVPLGWNEVDAESAATGTNKDKKIEAKKAAASVRIQLNGKSFPCKLSPSAEPGQIGWCVTSLRLPAGESTLQLEYVAELDFTDYEYSSSALTRFSPRVLDYPLFPAGYWKGNPAEVHVEIDPGPFAADPPPGFSKGDGRLWVVQWKAPDLKEKKNLRVEFPARRFESDQLARWNSRTYGKVEYQADSGLHRVLDGKLESAWCAKGKPVQLELRGRTETSLGTYCRFEGLAVTPGHLGSAEDFEKHPRVKRLRVSGCGGEPRAKMEFEFHQLKNPAEATEFLAIPYGHPLAEHYRCLKLEVLATEGEGEVCLSEVAGVVNCG